MNPLIWSLLTVFGTILGPIVASSFVFAQTSIITITVDDPRPVAAAVDKIEELSGIPINYEDMPVYYAGDLRDITEEVSRTRVSNRRILAQRRGQLSVPVVVDAGTGRLKDALDVKDALLTVISAYNSSGLPGAFDLEFFNGVFFVKPIRYRDANGATRPMTPVLSVPVTLPPVTSGVGETWSLILAPVESVVGGHVGRGQGLGGTGAISAPPPPPPTPNARRTPLPSTATGGGTQVSFGAQNEPAHHVIARLLATSSGPGDLRPDINWDIGLSYRMLFDATDKSYAISVLRVASSPRWEIRPAPPYSPPPRRPPDGRGIGIRRGR